MIQTRVCRTAALRLEGDKKDKLKVSELMRNNHFGNDFGKNCEKFDFESDNHVVSVKGRLKRSINFWHSIDANSYILSVIKNGYRIPFVNDPPKAFIKNNKSALDNVEFVSEAIIELVQSQAVIECDKPPWVVNPLTVAVNAKGKKRLVLDLRHVNHHIALEKIKFDDWKVALSYYSKNCFMYSFDFKSGYHHIDIDERYQEFLGFSWDFGRGKRFFMFTVLPFGLASAGHIFTKTVRCLVSHWRAQGLRILVYLDDGLGFGETFEHALFCSNKVRQDVIDSGFVPQEEKCDWLPSQESVFLGIGINTAEGVLSIPESKIVNIRKLAAKAAQVRKCTARKLAAITGKIISISIVAGNVTSLMTKHLHMAICTRSSWDSFFTLSDSEVEELLFWVNNIHDLKARPLCNTVNITRVVYSDASSTACGGYTVNVKDSVCHRTWSSVEQVKSSAWRELMGIKTVLFASEHLFKGQTLKWYSDNQSVVSIVKKGSMKTDLHAIALSIFKFCLLNNTRIEIEWIPRSLNDKADYISKIVDYDDWGVTTEFFNMLNGKWGKHTIDRFASYSNKKVVRFNSKFWTPGSLGIDAFAFDWHADNNWLVPPIYLVPRVLRHMQVCKCLGTLVVPLWKSSVYWPLLVKKDMIFNSFVKDFIVFNNTKGIFMQGSVKSIFDDSFRSPVIACRIDMR